MKIFRKTFLVWLLVSSIVLFSGCSLFRTKDPLPPIDKTEKNLVFYNMYDDSEIFEPLIQQYLSENPYVRITYKEFNDFEDYEKMVLNGLAEGEGPDIFAMPNHWFVRNKKKLTSMPTEMGTTTDVRATFVDVVSDDLITTDDNGIEQIYGLPMYVDSLALYYNKDHYEDRVPTTGRPALTWDGLKNDVYALAKLKDNSNLFEVAGVAMGLTENVTNAVDLLYALMIQNGTQFYNSVMSESVLASSVSNGQQAASNALDLYTSFADEKQKHYSWNKYVGKTYPQNDITAFAAGEVSVIVGYAHTYNQILSERNLLKADGLSVIDTSSVKTAPLPQLVDPSVATDKRDTYANYFALGVARTSEYSNEAWDFITFLTTPESEKFYFEQTHKPSSRRDLIVEQRLDPIYGTFVDQVGYAESFPIVDYFKYEELFKAAIDAVNTGKASKGALTEVQDQITYMLPKEGYIVPLNTEYYENQEKSLEE